MNVNSESEVSEVSERTHCWECTQCGVQFHKARIPLETVWCKCGVGCGEWVVKRAMLAARERKAGE